MTDVLDFYLDMLEKIQKQVHRATGPTFADSVALQKIIVMWSVLISSVGTRLEGNHMVSLHPLKYEGSFLQKKLSMGRHTFLGNFWGDCSTWGD